MPATTRSKTQTRLSDGKLARKRKASSSSGTTSPAKKVEPTTVKGEKPASKNSRNESRIEKEDEDKSDADAATDESPGKKIKTEEKQSNANDEDSTSIIINRAPVLELWSACLTSFLHPDLPWHTCLSIGSTISSLAAISKGRSIGTIPKQPESRLNSPSTADKQDKHTNNKSATNETESEDLHIMKFILQVKEGCALVSGKPRKGNEELLRRKFGGKYHMLRETFLDALGSWKGKEEELNERAFHMYEDFRPSVPTGQKGWGRKGVLDLERVRSVAENG